MDIPLKKEVSEVYDSLSNCPSIDFDFRDWRFVNPMILKTNNKTTFTKSSKALSSPREN